MTEDHIEGYEFNAATQEYEPVGRKDFGLLMVVFFWGLMPLFNLLLGFVLGAFYIPVLALIGWLALDIKDSAVHFGLALSTICGLLGWWFPLWIFLLV